MFIDAGPKVDSESDDLLTFYGDWLQLQSNISTIILNSHKRQHSIWQVFQCAAPLAHYSVALPSSERLLALFHFQSLGSSNGNKIYNP